MSTSRRTPDAFRRTDPARSARLQRDAGIERARSVTKGIAFGSVAAVAVAGVYLSQALPGHSASPTTSTGGAAGTPASSPGTATAAPGSSGGTSSTPAYSGGGSSYSAPSAPAYTPAPAYSQAPVASSGAS